MTEFDLYNCLKNSGKFTDLIFSEINSEVKYTPFAEIIYYINKEKYIIYLTSTMSYFFISCHPINEIKSLDMYVYKNEFNDLKRIISKFKLLLKKIDKLNTFVQNKKNDEILLYPIINGYIKKIYNFDIDLEYYYSGISKNYIKFKFSTSKYKLNNKIIIHKSNRINKNFKLFDTSKEDCAVYIINAYFNTNNANVNLLFHYDNKIKQLILINKYELYKSKQNDITSIIRKEKLINLMIND